MNSNISESAQTQTLIRSLSNIGSNINLYTALVLNPIGFVTNMISLYVYTRPRLNKTNMGFLYFWQTASDICLLGMLIFIGRAREIFGQALGSQGEGWCIFTSFIRRFLVHISSWINVLICFDRFMFVLFPNNKFMKSKLNLTLIIASIFATLTLVNTPNFFSGLSVPRGNETRVCSASPLILNLAVLISIFTRTIVPLIVMSLMNLMIIKRLRLNKQKLTQNRNKKEKKETRFTKTVVSLTLIFMLFNFPLGVINSVSIFTDYLGFTVSPTTGAVLSLCSIVALNFSFLYQSFYFFITLMFNQIFRKELISIFAIVIAKNSIEASTTGTGASNSHHGHVRPSKSAPKHHLHSKGRTLKISNFQ
jgi:hypothetical protein